MSAEGLFGLVREVFDRTEDEPEPAIRVWVEEADHVPPGHVAHRHAGLYYYDVPVDLAPKMEEPADFFMVEDAKGIEEADHRDPEEVLNDPDEPSTNTLALKRRVYVDSPSEVPQGARLQEGERGGLYYETEESESFEEAMAEASEQVFEEHDFTEEQREAANELRSSYEETADSFFESVVESGGELVTSGKFRVKTTASMLEKVHVRDNEYESVSELDDVFGGRVLAEEAQQIDELADRVEDGLREHGLEIAEKEDYVEDPQSYYRAVHLTVADEEGRTFEVQVKSEDIDEIIEVGHETVYKNVHSMPEDDLEEVRDCLEQLIAERFGERPDHECTDTAVQTIGEVAA